MLVTLLVDLIFHFFPWSFIFLFCLNSNLLYFSLLSPFQPTFLYSIRDQSYFLNNARDISWHLWHLIKYTHTNRPNFSWKLCHNSIRGCVHPSVGLSVGPLVHQSVPTFFGGQRRAGKQLILCIQIVGLYLKFYESDFACYLLILLFQSRSKEHQHF